MEENEGEEVEEGKIYDIKRSMRSVGPLYPVLIDGKGRIIDGHHRLREDPNWPIFKLDNIKTRTQFLMARLIANLHRRQMTEEEKRQMLADLKKETGWSNKKIARELGVSDRWVRKYMPDEFKNQVKAEAGRKGALALAERRSAEIAVKEKVKDLEFTESGLPPPEEALVYNPEIDDSIRFVESLDMWFMRPNDPVLIALTDYCKDKRVNWKILVREILEEFLKREGYL